MYHVVPYDATTGRNPTGRPGGFYVVGEGARVSFVSIWRHLVLRCVSRAADVQNVVLQLGHDKMCVGRDSNIRKM